MTDTATKIKAVVECTQALAESAQLIDTDKKEYLRKVISSTDGDLCDALLDSMSDEQIMEICNITQFLEGAFMSCQVTGIVRENEELVACGHHLRSIGTIAFLLMNPKTRNKAQERFGEVQMHFDFIEQFLMGEGDNELQ